MLRRFNNHLYCFINILHSIIIPKAKPCRTINVFYTHEFEYLYEYLLQTVLGHNTSFKNSNWSNPNYKTLHPGVITKTFIGDAKYYRIRDHNNNSFEKELYAYNIANDNSQPNIVFIPSEESKHLKTLIHSSNKLEVVTINIKDILHDYKTNSTITLQFVESLIMQ